MSPVEHQLAQHSSVHHRSLHWRRLPYVFAIGLIFLLPHLVRMATLGSVRQYSPFSVITSNNVVWDESFAYAAQANVLLQQHRGAGDTDSWEHRSAQFPYSVLPAALEVSLAQVLA